jgi:hypothetical protein
MSIALKPKQTEPDGNISPIFNINTFHHANDYASKADLLSYANLYNANYFQYLNTFANGLNFNQTINGISSEIFAYVAYLPNIIFELTNFSYDSVNNSTHIIGNTYFQTASIESNLNIGSSLNVDTILNQKMISNDINANSLSVKRLVLNNQIYYEAVCYIYLNGITLPLQKSNLISNFNIPSITTFYFTLKNGVRLDIVDANDIILYSYTNTMDDFVYYQQIPYNSNMIKVNLYNSFNAIIV